MTSAERPGACPYVEPIETETVRPPTRLRLAVAGKGGSGKTTIAGTLARVAGRMGRPVVAVDADTNPGLAGMLGVASEAVAGLRPLPRSLIRRQERPDGTATMVFTGDPIAVLEDYGTPGPDAVRLIVMGAVGQGGAG